MKPGRILGIDPGLHITGYGVLETSPQRPKVCEAGIIRCSGRDMATRLLFLYNGIVEVIDQFHPQVLAADPLYAHYPHPPTTILMGHAPRAAFPAAQES